MIYALSIFLSSFLLFLVQPLIARIILPWFGGSASVWTTCMLFFQVLLLAGYGYAHLLNTRVAPRNQRLVHLSLLVASLATMPIVPAESWKPAGGEEPVLHILVLLGATVGLPYFLLASTSPLVQVWFSRARPAGNAYRLYAVSNLASLLALVGYPFVVEPVLTGGSQLHGWSWLYAAFALLSGFLAWTTPAPVSRPHVLGGGAGDEASDATGRVRVWLWMGLAATGSVLLLAVTNHLTQNVASIPLLWLAPLTLYLLSFIVAFEGKDLYRPRLLWPLVLLWLGAMAWLLVDADFRFDLGLQLAVFLPGLFLGCLFCHGELYRTRPHSGELTRFYLILSAGGAFGGLLVAVVAPLSFHGYYELGAGLVAFALLALMRFSGLGRLPRYSAAVVLIAVSACAIFDATRDQEGVRYVARGFYGVLKVKEYGAGEPENHVRRLVHGTIMHGEQYVSGTRRDTPTTYYSESSGIAAAIRSRGAGPVRIGVIGLGTGTLAAYGRPGDVYRFYDIDSRVVQVARREFSYLSDSKAEVEIVIGDARLQLEREAPQKFDVLAVDAFSSDAIPVHLITREAVNGYLRHLAPDGIVVFHISNRFLDLAPVVGGIAEELGLRAVKILDRPDEDDAYKSQSDWILVSRSPEALERKEIAAAGAETVARRSDLRAWTDDYSNVVQIVKEFPGYRERVCKLVGALLPAAWCSS